MTLEEYKNLLLDNGIIECDSERTWIYLFTQKGMDMIREKFPEYPTGWVGAIRDGVFWGIKPEETNAYDWTWYYPTENQKAMEYIVNDIFNLNTDTDYIELDDIVL
jgi:hypothetical protein